MSTKTSNFEYIKPGEDEFYNITEFNQTLDKIDADMKALKDTEENHTDNATVYGDGRVMVTMHIKSETELRFESLEQTQAEQDEVLAELLGGEV